MKNGGPIDSADLGGSSKYSIEIHGRLKWGRVPREAQCDAGEPVLSGVSNDTNGYS